MASENFARALKLVLVHEGGFSNHPKDPGGVTLQGVIQRVYDADRRRRNLPTKPLTKAMLGTSEWETERDAIYRRQYWDAVKGDRLPSGIDYCVFDGAVNSGPAQSIKWLQRALGVTADGVLSTVTLSAVEDHGDPDQLISDICARRMAFLKALKTFSTFGRGWTTRVEGVRKIAQQWTTGDHAPVYATGMDKKATIDQRKKAPSVSAADATTGSGVATGGLGGALQQARDALDPLAAMSEHIAMIITVLVVSGVVLTASGLVYRWYANRRARQLADDLDMHVVPA